MTLSLSRSKRAGLGLVILALVSTWHLYSNSTFNAGPGAQITFKKERVVVYERAIHDEVTGAIAASLTAAGIIPLYICAFRFKFGQVMGRIMAPFIPNIVSPWQPANQVERLLKLDEIDTLVLTTCGDSLPLLLPLLLQSTTKVICVVHHSGAWVYHHDKKAISQLIPERRIALVTLGEHVRKSLQDDVLQWAENEGDQAWLDLPILTLIPTFDEPGPGPRTVPLVFPSRAVIQGNIEPGRRRYDKIFADLNKSMSSNPSLWGYTKVTGQTALVKSDDPSASPFSLHLVGQVNKEHLVEIPKELGNVVEFHQGLDYPEFYQLLTGMDLMIPAFATPGTYKETASSSMATSVIARIPVLVTERHLAAYTYIVQPGYIQHSVAESEIQAIEALRSKYRHGVPRASDEEWTRYQQSHIRLNVLMWRACWEFLHGGEGVSR